MDIESKQQRKLLVSAWPFVLAAILPALLTPFLSNLHGTGHWAAMQTAYQLQGGAEKIFRKQTLDRIAPRKYRLLRGRGELYKIESILTGKPRP